MPRVSAGSSSWRASFMRFLAIAAVFAIAAASFSQNVSSVYNRDTHDPFKLKDVKVESTVFGPIVRTSTLLTFENPYTKLTEASLNFDLPEEAALGGFAYYYGDEYVKGQLMDKAKAWFIYTAITSRNRDPGIMEQVSPTSYHCQIYPLKVGSDLRVRLYTVGFLQPQENKLGLPAPQVGDARVPQDWSVRMADFNRIENGANLTLPMPEKPVTAVAQRFKDGRTYVAGMMRADPERLATGPELKILKAEYGLLERPSQVWDVTEKLSSLAKRRSLELQVYNQVFGGDPAPGIVKTLRVTYEQGGKTHTKVVPESALLQIGMINSGASPTPTFARLRDPKWVQLDDETIAFMGWVPSNRKIAVRHNGLRQAFRPQLAHKGSESARLWAQQKLAQGNWTSKKQVLNFSMKYGVPSAYTALLAVPQSEMKLFKAKEKEFQKEQQRQARQEREWAKQREQNWRSGRGGDPEIRVQFADAQSVDAVLPDGRVIPLELSNGTWGGNFDIPVAAPEGQYTVRVVAVKRDGTTEEKKLTYDVDRTAPEGKAEIRMIGGRRMLEVRSEAGLAEVAFYLADGSKMVLKEEEPGVYRLELARFISVKGTLVLKDSASNKREIPCSWPS
ncbi:MAG: VIT domain-containing protein [Fimbriimonas sp.]